MTHDIVDWLLAICSIAAIVYSSFGVYRRARRDARFEKIEEVCESNKQALARIEGFLSAICHYKP